MSAFKEVRDVIIKYDAVAVAFPIDAYASIAAKVREIEDRHVLVAQTDLTASKIVLTGRTPYKIYVFDITSVMATGTYTFEFQEVAPNVDEATTL